jgi:anhydro-N-acetylmuramic acid kinase
MAHYKVIGLMSGTSLDGLDLAYCEFSNDPGKWEYIIRYAETIPYSEDWFSRLSSLTAATAYEYASADHAYGHLLGNLTREFIEKHDITADFIASHGHTVFHQPARGFTSQIGNGAAIKSETGLPVICDFRSGDVAAGGQGAPLVPAGDKLLFPEFDYCLNLGGFANISFDRDGERVAFDVCPVNVVINKIARKEGLPYDRDGMLAEKGLVDTCLLGQLDRLPYYNQAGPKSLGIEWVEENIFPLLERSGLNNKDILCTYYTHIAHQIAITTGSDLSKKLLATGGGAHNNYLISLIGKHIKPRLVKPNNLTVNFKESIIFAFIGILRWRNEINCLKTVTGAGQDGSYGAIY